MMKKFIANGNPKTQPSKWLRTSFIDDEGTLYLPCAMFGNEPAAFLCIAFDCIPVRLHKNHVYAPVWWLMNEYPKHREKTPTINPIKMTLRETADDFAKGLLTLILWIKSTF